MPRVPFAAAIVTCTSLTALCIPLQAAQACGGMFCDQQAAIPVEQAAENIVFAIDEQTGRVDVHVQISFQGSADEFAWVVPVPSEPQLFLSSQALFDRLEPATQPQWTTTSSVEGKCKQPRRRIQWPFGGGAGGDDGDLNDTDATLDSDSGVSVVATETVGPYDTVTLQATSADELLTWLQDSGYDLPSDLSPSLEPYLSDGNHFVALKLRQDRTVGDIAPLGMSYDSEVAQIPLMLTAIAATPDMRIRPYVFASERAVPDNYLHVRINQLAIDWIGNGYNYPDVVTRAANEAGGQAFATDFAGSTADLRDLFVTLPASALDASRQENRPRQLLDDLRDLGVPVTETTAAIYAQHIQVPKNAPTALDYFQCPECFGFEQDTVNAAALIDALVDEWLEPLQRVHDMVRTHPYVTRMTSSMSAEEMTDDPLFVLNPDMDGVPLERTAHIVTECSRQVFQTAAPRRLELPNGQFTYLPPSAGRGNAEQYARQLGDIGNINALYIENTGQSGPPELLTDRSAELDALLIRQPVTSCGGCQSTGAGLAWLPLGGLGLLWGRRRRHATRRRHTT